MDKKALDYNRKRWSTKAAGIVDFTNLVRRFQESNGLVVDGMFGPITAKALREGVEEKKISPEKDVEPEKSSPHIEVISEWATWDGPLEKQPRNRSEVYKMFGTPGVAGRQDKKWTRANIVKAVIPGLPRHVWVNKHVEPYLREAIRRARLSCPGYEIYSAGVHNFRHIRHDPSRPLSMHSWGIAIDINPKDNWTKSYARGRAPEAWTERYMRQWPRGVPKAFVEAFQSCGFAWGSDWDEDGSTADHTFLDPMHFEWVARDGVHLDV